MQLIKQPEHGRTAISKKQKLCSVKLSDRHSMKDLREKLKLRNVQEHIESCRLRWFGHVTRMDDERWPKSMLNYNVAGAYPRGRPKKRWMDNVRKDMKSLNINAELAVDRENWRRVTQKKMYSPNASNPG